MLLYFSFFISSKNDDKFYNLSVNYKEFNRSYISYFSNVKLDYKIANSK
jgi:hypothetical protein